MEIDSDTISWIWFIAGVVLIVSEFFLPGIVAVFMGIGAVIVAVLRWFGIIESFSASFGVWLLSSTLLVISLRRLVQRMFPSESTYKSEDDNVNAFDSTVTVIETVYEDNSKGRIRFQGTSWPATSLQGTIEKGEKAKIVSKNNIGWIIRQYDIDEEQIKAEINE